MGKHSAMDNDRTYQQIAKAINFFAENQSQQPSLADLAGYVGLSEFHLQRLFSEWVGVSPKQYLQHLTKEAAKGRLRESSVFDAAIGVGLSGAGRLHDLMVTHEGVTPGQYKQFGKDLQIYYGVHDSPFGYCFLAITERGVCKLAFFDTEEQKETLENELASDWCEAAIAESSKVTMPVIEEVFPNECSLSSTTGDRTLHLLLKGSKFQLKVWEALLCIPYGEVASYQNVAQHMGSEKSVRAVASAVARNKIGYLVPCHRVIRSSGDWSNYRWGDTRKKAIIGWEASTK